MITVFTQFWWNFTPSCRTQKNIKY